jgi:hypothetical protein
MRMMKRSSGSINRDEIEAAGISFEDMKKVVRAANRFMNLCEELGVSIFGGACGLQLRFNDHRGETRSDDLILWSRDGNVDGGDGGCSEDEDGLIRGETW